MKVGYHQQDNARKCIVYLKLRENKNRGSKPGNLTCVW